MARAIVLINTDVGTEEEVVNNLLQIPEVKEVHIVYGVYDVITVIEAKDHNELRRVVVTKLRKVPHIRSTTTMVVVETYTK